MQKMLIFLTAFLLSQPLFCNAETLYFYGNKWDQEDLSELIVRNPLDLQENLKATLIHKSEEVSIHLVQIRFREKPHIHKTHDLLVILKKGRGVLHIGNEGVPMFENDSALIPKGMVHYFENSGEEVAAGIGIFIPPYDETDMIVVEEALP